MLVLRKEFLDIQATKECRLYLKRACDLMRTHSKYQLELKNCFEKLDSTKLMITRQCTKVLLK